MASMYCPDCNRQAGDNWTECYFCGGKNLKEGEPSPVTSKKARRKANKDGYPDRPRRGGKRGWIQFCLFMFGLFGVIVIVNLCNYAKSL